MEYRQLGRTDIDIPEVILGAWQFSSGWFAGVSSANASAAQGRRSHEP
jgi:aryl-alcohol dehydrogenase-like predicted oxidoreductase